MTELLRPRIASIDVLRGAVMIIMALDHARDFFHITAMTADPLDPSSTSIPLFFTRWITHFCAPLFVFLSGTSAYISRQNKTQEAASWFLVKRGVWLILVELALITFLLTFNPFYNVLILQVIWVIGCSMILLGIISRVSYWLVAAIGLLLVITHNITDYLVLPQQGLAAVSWKILFTAFGTMLPVGNNHFILVLYALLPWTGLMCCGYVMGKLYAVGFPARKRQEILVLTGFLLIAVFIVLRFINGYGDPSHWKIQDTRVKTILSFLNVSKYPPSFLYMCITIGPGMLALAILEKMKGWFIQFLSVYGQVPFFYYVLHFFIIHTVCVVLFYATGHNSSQIADPNIPFLFRPLNFGFRLPIVYIIWISVVLSLYYPCKWFRNYKILHRKWWVSYL
jgi:uncharacterized membrane protein